MSLPQSHARELRRIVSTLLHDVGKYVARTARNVRDRPTIEGALADMLLRDVYETHHGRRASVRFAELAAELEALSFRDPRLSEARVALERIDALEAPARAGDAPSLASLATAAIEVEATLRALARDVAGQAYR